jgi:hypothetical protein
VRVVDEGVGIELQAGGDEERRDREPVPDGVKLGAEPVVGEPILGVGDPQQRARDEGAGAGPLPRWRRVQ